MNRRGIGLTVLCLLWLGTAAAKYELRESWFDPDRAVVKRHRIGIVGISADSQTRHRFEDKFVSHLQGRGHEAVTSYSMVPDLAVVENRDFLISSILERKIEGVISLRVVHLGNKNEEEAWADGWREKHDSEVTLRSIIDESLPFTGTKSKRYGVEIALWDTQSWRRVWAGRTGTHSLKALRNGAGDIVQLVIRTLESDGLL